MTTRIHDTTRPRYSVVVPVYDSHGSVERMVDRTAAVFEGTVRHPYEIILVDDGSRAAQTWMTLKRLANQRPGVIVAIRLTRNFGKASAVLCGLGRARGRWVITLDDDLQQRPEDIPKLIPHEDHDVVVANFEAASRPVRGASSWVKGQFDRVILGVPCRMSPLKLIASRGGSDAAGKDEPTIHSRNARPRYVRIFPDRATARGEFTREKSLQLPTSSPDVRPLDRQFQRASAVRGGIGAILPDGG